MYRTNIKSSASPFSFFLSCSWISFSLPSLNLFIVPSLYCISVSFPTSVHSVFIALFQIFSFFIFTFFSEIPPSPEPVCYLSLDSIQASFTGTAILSYSIVHVRHQSINRSLISSVSPSPLLQASLWTHTPVWTLVCRWTEHATVTICPSARCWGSCVIQATSWVMTSRWCARGTTGGATPSQAAMVWPYNSPYHTN